MASIPSVSRGTGVVPYGSAEIFPKRSSLDGAVVDAAFDDLYRQLKRHFESLSLNIAAVGCYFALVWQKKTFLETAIDKIPLHNM